ncbi:TPA: hypothetical protein KEY91_002714 [Proteus mirabilis]|uniref:hypothetical protein n=1 Tax=Proteus mirabilis TaxID=584 RepID=UPI0002833545|nr:hypothetical protein [Proteus mirabilis]EJD6084789.1 hypothetical protein [Proteus mirabilis]EKA98632.1 hypothetical protein HMPREF1310_01194 [Proteus mirabilis WGLW4]ELT8661323.1 hypothetical protein [Proteus mirabilis]KAB7721722.1 hypothetical protein GBN13_10670 [Proteus mirabilis]MBG2804883.1 hypothetical protein [Proteus mirabilis]
MDELISLFLAGAMIPTIAILVKKFLVDRAFKKIQSEILVKNKDGKKLKFFTTLNVTDEEVKKIFESELNFEINVKKNIDKFIAAHKNLNFELSNGKYVDFILSYADKVIAIEAKSNANLFKAEWISDYFKENADVDELIMIINSKIPKEFIEEKNKLSNGKKISFIAAPREKELNKLLTNVLVNGLGLKK